MMMIALMFLMILVAAASDSKNRPVVFPMPLSLCINQSYTLPLFSTRYILMEFNRTQLEQNFIRLIRCHASVVDRKVIQFENGTDIFTNVIDKNDFHTMDDRFQNHSRIMISWKVHASYINRTVIHYVLETVKKNGHIDRINCSIDILVSGPQRLLDKVFKGTIPFLIGFVSIQMGILLDIDVLKEIFRRPIPVIIGFTCQYGLMPLIAFAISKIFHYSPLYGLGIFVVGCCPGGAISNQWTVMFNGDLNLSAFMSFASTVASFFMMPLWLYTLGQYAYLRELKIYIPFKNLAVSLITIIGPLAVGMVIVYFIPKIKKLIQHILKPTLVLLICYFFIFGGFANFYLVKYINLQTALTAPLLPWFGFILGGVVAWICRQDWSRVKTIGIETGIQNIGIAFMVLLYSFPAPENSQASVIPLIIAYLSPQPFYILLIVRFIQKKCVSKNKKTTVVLKAEVDNTSDDIQSKAIHQLIESNEVQESDEDEHRENALLPAVSVMNKSPDTKPVEV